MKQIKKNFFRRWESDFKNIKNQTLYKKKCRWKIIKFHQDQKIVIDWKFADCGKMRKAYKSSQFKIRIFGKLGIDLLWEDNFKKRCNYFKKIIKCSKKTFCINMRSSINKECRNLLFKLSSFIFNNWKISITWQTML